MSPNWLLSLPLDDPIVFGRSLRRLAEEVLSPNDRRQAVYALVDALVHAGFRVNYSTASGWTRGDLNQLRGRFTPEHFRVLVTQILWGHPDGITSPDEIIALARCAGTYRDKKLEIPYASFLDNDWFHEFVTQHPVTPPTPPPADVRYPSLSFSIPREQARREIFERIAHAQAARSPIVITGASGIGKTTLLHQISQDKELRGRFPDTHLVATLGGQSADVYLRSWYQQLFQHLPFGLRGEEQTHRIKRFLRGKRCLILIDDIAKMEYVAPLLVGDPEYSLTILTTHDKIIAQTLATKGYLRIHLDGFTAEETRRYYEKAWGKPVDNNLPFVDQLNQALLGNPLALHFAFHTAQERGFEPVLRLLRSQDANVPEGFLPGIFTAMRVNYERLPPFWQRRFNSLGALPPLYGFDWVALAALWETDWHHLPVVKDKTEASLTELQSRTGIFIQVESGLWQLHQQVHLFAQSKLNAAPIEEQQQALQWEDRLNLSRAYSFKHIGFRRAWATLREMRWGLQRPRDLKPQENVLRRVVKTIFDRQYSTVRRIVQTNRSAFTAREYFVATKLAEQDQRGYRLAFGVGLLVLFFRFCGVILNTLGYPVPNWLLVANALALIVFILTGVIWVASAFLAEAEWLELQKGAIKRIQKRDTARDA